MGFIKDFIKIISTAKASIVLLSVYAVSLALATFIERLCCTDLAKSFIYYSPFLFLIQFLMVVNFIGMVVQRKLLKWKNKGMLLIHAAFIIILTGAFTTFLFGEEGYVHLREGEKVNHMMRYDSAGNQYTKKLPFELELIKFHLKKYPGSNSPSSYESNLKIYVDGTEYESKIYMNNVLDIKGYRFFQASFDKDEKGSLLSVNRDVYGKNITYIGYTILLIGFLISVLGKGSRFHLLRKRTVRMKELSVVLLLLVGGDSLFAADNNEERMGRVVQQLSINKEHSDAFGMLTVQSVNGRMKPINTFSSEILRKLYREDRIGGMDSDQFLLSLLAMPQMWMRVPLIEIKNKTLVATFDLSYGRCSYLEVFDEKGEYKLQDELDRVYSKNPVLRTGYDKDLIKLDEQINTFHQLIGWKLLNIFPLKTSAEKRWYAPGDDLSAFDKKDSVFVKNIFDMYLDEVRLAIKNNDWSRADDLLLAIKKYQETRGKELVISDKQARAELMYNKFNLFRYCKIGYLVLGGLLLFLTLLSLFYNHTLLNRISNLLISGIGFFFIAQIVGMLLRSYISGYAPWSNSYETMVYVGWATVLAGFFFLRKSRITFALATLFGGIILFVSGLNWMDPQINPLLPVLKSPWLMFHVAIVVAAYGFFGISFLIGITNMVLMILQNKLSEKKLIHTRIEDLTILNEMSLWIGLALMTIGTFLGAVWANVSWGRYWGWDPKETWALITMIVYAIILHLHLVRLKNRTWFFNFMSIMSFSTVLMTFLGVNYFLSGMHSYGENDEVNRLFIYIVLALLLVVFLAFWAFKEIRTLKMRNML